MTTDRALEVWSLLESAYYNDNSYGGNEAEIYIYMFMAHCPVVISRNSLACQMRLDAYESANIAMYELFNKFSKHRGVKLTVEDKPLGKWIKTAGFQHRVHVKVEH